MSAAELDLLLGALSTSREGRLSNEDRLFMSIPPSPASAAKKPSSGDQVLALKRDEKKGRKKKPMLTGQKLHLIRSMEETQLKQKQQELAQHQQKMHEAEQRLTEEQETMLGLQVSVPPAHCHRPMCRHRSLQAAQAEVMMPVEDISNDSPMVDARIDIKVVRAAEGMEARCPSSPRLLGCHLPLDT
jgi:hypothetical protein